MKIALSSKIKKKGMKIAPVFKNKENRFENSIVFKKKRYENSIVLKKQKGMKIEKKT